MEFGLGGVFFLVYCCTVNVGVIALMVFCFLKCICDKVCTNNHPRLYAIVTFVFVTIIIGCAYATITKEDYAQNLCITIGIITLLTAILLFSLMFRVFEVLYMEAEIHEAEEVTKDEKVVEYKRRLQRKEKELSIGGALLSFLGVAFPLFVQANSAPYSTAGYALGLSAFDLVSLLLMFTWYAEIVWNCNEQNMKLKSIARLRLILRRI